MNLKRCCFTALIISLAGCGAPRSTDVDAGNDSGVVVTDAGAIDSGMVDAGIPDAGIPDAGIPDAGMLPACPDATHREDGGSCISNLVGWTVGPSLLSPRRQHVTFLVQVDAGTFVYAAGGSIGTLLKSIERSRLDEAGNLTAWQDAGTLPNNASGAGVAVIGRTVIVTGGYRDGPYLSKLTELSTVNEDGTFGPWSLGPEMALTRFQHGSVAYKGSVYVAGGFTGNNTINVTSVQRAVLQPDGTLGAWQNVTALPGPRSTFSMVAHDDALYISGGLGPNDERLTGVIRAGIAADGTLGNWEPVTPLPISRVTHSSFVHGGHLYVVGGFGPVVELVTVIRARILPGAQLGEWEQSAPLPNSRTYSHHAPGLGGRVYSVGGGIMGVSQTDAWMGTLQ